MKKFFASLWNLFCVPVMVLLTGIAAVILFRLLQLAKVECSITVRFIVCLALLLISMIFLAKKPKRTLVLSSLIACGLCLIVQLLGLAAMRVQVIGAIYPYLITYVAVPFHISLPISADNMQSLLLSVLALAVTTFLPMVYCFSGVMRRSKKKASGVAEE